MSIKNDLEVLKRELETNHDRNMAAIDHLLARIREPAALVLSVQALKLKHPDKVKMAEEIIRSMTGDFDNFDIRVKLQDAIEKETGEKPYRAVNLIVSQVINKLRHRNPPEIDVVSPGRGSCSGTYKVRHV